MAGRKHRSLAQAPQQHLHLHTLELLAALTMTMIAMFLTGYQSATSERLNWQSPDFLLLLLYLALFICPVLILRINNPLLPVSGKFGLFTQSPRRALLRAVAYFVVAYGLTMIVLFLTLMICEGLGSKELPVHDTLEKLQEETTVRQKLLLILMPIFLAPLFEELIFRGLLQCGLIRAIAYLQHKIRRSSETAGVTALARWIGILLAALVFAGYHADWQHWPALFVLAVCLGYSYEKENNLAVPIIVHALFNAVPIVITLWGC